jgi:hypothetical protein
LTRLGLAALHEISTVPARLCCAALWARNWVAAKRTVSGDVVCRMIAEDIIDSALLDLSLTPGGFGAMLYPMAIGYLRFNATRYTDNTDDTFICAARTIGFALTTTLLITS